MPQNSHYFTLERNPLIESTAIPEDCLVAERNPGGGFQETPEEFTSTPPRIATTSPVGSSPVDSGKSRRQTQIDALKRLIKKSKGLKRVVYKKLLAQLRQESNAVLPDPLTHPQPIVDHSVLPDRNIPILEGQTGNDSLVSTTGGGGSGLVTPEKEVTQAGIAPNFRQFLMISGVGLLLYWVFK